MIKKESLDNLVIKGIYWRSFANIAQHIAQIVFTIVLARLLSKSDFGLLAIALIVNRFVRTFTQFGFGTAVIQSQEINEGQISAIFYIQSSFNLILSFIVFLSAGFFSDYFGEPDLIPIIKVMSCIIFIRSFRYPFVLMRKNMNFKDFSLIEIYSLIFSNVIAIILALLNFGVWSLVFRQILATLSSAILSFYYSKWVPKNPDFSNILSFFKFGFNLLGSNIINFATQNVVGILTAKFLGKDIMGLFTIAYNLAITPSSKIQSILTSVLTPGYSRLQYEIGKFKKNYVKAIRVSCVFFIPFMILLGSSSESLVLLFYGDKWIGSASILELLVFVGIFRGINYIMVSSIIAKGKPNFILISSFLDLLISLPFMYYLLPIYKINGLIFGYFIGSLFNFLLLSYYFDKIVANKFVVIKALKNSLIFGFMIFLLSFFIKRLNFNYFLEFTSIFFFGFITLMLLIYYFERELLIKLKSKIISRHDKKN